MSGQQGVVPGGLTDETDATKDVQAVCDKVKLAVMQRMDRISFDMYVALRYRSQVVEGMNYFVKLRIGEDEYIEVRIYQALGNVEPVLDGLQPGKTATDPVVYIEPFK